MDEKTLAEYKLRKDMEEAGITIRKLRDQVSHYGKMASNLRKSERFYRMLKRIPPQFLPADLRGIVAAMDLINWD